jgi:hypothetical protein
VKQSFKRGDKVELLSEDGYGFLGSAMNGHGFSDVYGIVDEVGATYTAIHLFSKRTGEILSLSDSTHHWNFNSDQLRKYSLFTRIRHALIAILCAPDVRDRYNTGTPEETTDDEDSEGMAMIQRELDGY